MLRSCCFRSLERCLGIRKDELLWHMDLKPHASGDFSIAVVQANSSLEDQSQVYTSPSAIYIGVYDGHGGPEASRFINRHLFPYLHKFTKEHGGLSVDVIKKAFNAIEEDFTRLVKQSLPVRPQIVSVGSCCLVGAISDGELYVANLGDSRAVLGSKSSVGKRNSVVAERLSTDHNVSCEKVRREVEAQHPDDSLIVVNCRGVWRIRGIIQESHALPLFPLSHAAFCIRDVLEDIVRQSVVILVSRSIGDVYLKKPDFNRDPLFLQFGNPVPLRRPLLTAEPSIVTRKLRPQDLFLIFASDGLWEHLSDEAAVDIVYKYPRAGIAKRLVGAAIHVAAKKREVRYKDIRKIEKGVRRHFHDDITVIVIYLDHDHHKSPKHKQGSVGIISAPVDIFSYNSDEVEENPVDKIFPNEESRHILAVS